MKNSIHSISDRDPQSEDVFIGIKNEQQVFCPRFLLLTYVSL